MRVVIVGAGVAGLTLAVLLSRQGRTPVVIDKQPDDADPGYVVALWPHGTRVLHALGVHEDCVARSEPMLRYTLKNGDGRLIGSCDSHALMARFGHLGVIARPDFIKVLGRALDGGVEVRRDLSVESLSQAADHVDVRLTDGSRARFDLVISADGMHSRVRELLFGRLTDRDTGYGCYVWWADASLAANGETTEHWGAGSFLGLYPCRDQVGVVAGAPIDVLQPSNPSGRTDRLKSLVAHLDVSVDKLFAGLPVCRTMESRSICGAWRMSGRRTGCRGARVWSETPRPRSCQLPASVRRWRWSRPPRSPTSCPAQTQPI